MDTVHGHEEIEAIYRWVAANHSIRNIQLSRLKLENGSSLESVHSFIAIVIHLEVIGIQDNFQIISVFFHVHSPDDGCLFFVESLIFVTSHIWL